MHPRRGAPRHSGRRYAGPPGYEGGGHRPPVRAGALLLRQRQGVGRGRFFEVYETEIDVRLAEAVLHFYSRRSRK